MGATQFDHIGALERAHGEVRAGQRHARRGDDHHRLIAGKRAEVKQPAAHLHALDLGQQKRRVFPSPMLGQRMSPSGCSVFRAADGTARLRASEVNHNRCGRRTYSQQIGHEAVSR